MAEEDNYTKRELDNFFKQQQEAHKHMEQKMDEGFNDLKNRLDFTNGKIKKITIALVFAFGLIIGLGATSFSQVVRLFF